MARTIRVKKVRWCDPEVKVHIHRHVKCDMTRTPSYFSGKKINTYLGINNLNESQQYRVCRSVATLMQKRTFTPEKKRKTPSTPTRSSTRITPTRINLSGIKSITIRSGGASVTSDGDNTMGIDFRKRESLQSNYANKVSELSENYYKSFRVLSVNERRRRVNEFGQQVLASCVNRKHMRSAGSVEYLKDDSKFLAVDVLTILDGIKYALLKKLKVNERAIADLVPEPVSPEEDEEEPDGGSIAVAMLGEEETREGNTDGCSTAVAMLGEATREGYGRIRKEMMKEYSLTSEELPTYYILTKQRPKIEPILLHHHSILSISNDESILDDIDSVQECSINERSVTTVQQNDEDLALIATGNAKLNCIEGAKVEGNVTSWLKLMAEKHKRMGRDVSGDIICLDSYDGAEHMRSNKRRINVVSFSSQLFSKSAIVNNKCSTGKSIEIFTWQQIMAEETHSTMLPAVTSVFTERELVKKSESSVLPGVNSISFYDMHDGKMLYLLTQHSAWNRKHHPFLLCKCKRGDGVRNPYHECVRISHGDQIKYFNHSKKRWEERSDDDAGLQYTMEMHKNWIDEKNYGISHFGIHPDKLCRDNIRFDIFHMKSAITKKIMAYLRVFMLSQSDESVDKFSKLLLRFWGEYHEWVWSNNKPFSSFQGNELAAFRKNIPIIVNFLSGEFVDSDHVSNMVTLLKSWHDIPQFLGITKIESVDWYKTQMTKYLTNVKKLYEVGAKTILKGDNVCDDETFYLHVLRFYIPDLSEVTLKKHQLGIGIFTMQGFERRNKESKNCFRRFTNKRGNVVCQTMKRLWDIYNYGKNAC